MDDNRLAAEVVAVLKRVRSCIARGWCQKDFAQDGHGNLVEADADNACRWSIWGAVLSAGANTRRAAMGRVIDVLLTCPELATSGMCSWNNKPDRTQDEVLRLLDTAITRAEKGGYR